MNFLTSFELGLIVGGVGGVLIPLLGYACMRRDTNSTPTVTASDNSLGANSTPTDPASDNSLDANSIPTDPSVPATSSNESPIRSKIVCLTIESMSDAAIDECIDAYLYKNNHQPTSRQLEQTLLNTVHGKTVIQQYLAKHNGKLQHWVRQRLKVLHETGARHRKAILNPYNNDVNLFKQSLEETARKMMVDQATHVENVLHTKNSQPQPQPLQDQNLIPMLPDEILLLICTWLGTKHGSRFSASSPHVAGVFQPVVNRVVDPSLNCFEVVFATEKNSLVRMIFSSFRNIKRKANAQTRLSVSRWWDCRKLATNILLGELELASEKIQRVGVDFGIGVDSITERLNVGSDHWVDGGKHPGYVCPNFATESGEEFPAIQELIQLDYSQTKDLIWCPSALLFFRSGRFKLLKTESEQQLITNSQIKMLNLLVKAGLDVHREKAIVWKFSASALAQANFPTFQKNFQKKNHSNGSLLSLAVQKLDLRLVMFLVNEAKVKVELFDQPLHQWPPPQDHFLLDVFVACPRLLALGEAIPELWSVPGSDKCKFTPIRMFLLKKGAKEEQFCKFDLAIEKSMRFVRAEV